MGDIAKGIKSFKAGMKEGENEEIETEAETIDDTKTKETKAKRTSKKSKK